LKLERRIMTEKSTLNGGGKERDFGKIHNGRGDKAFREEGWKRGEGEQGSKRQNTLEKENNATWEEKRNGRIGVKNNEGEKTKWM